MRTFKILAALSTLVAVGNAGAQNARQELPAEPLVERLKANTEWTASIARKVPMPEPKTENEIKLQQRRDLMWPELESATGYRGEKALEITYRWRGGKSSSGYVVDGILFRADNPNYPAYISINDPSVGSAALDYRKSDFPELYWLSAKTFVEETTQSGRPCYLYKLSGGEGEHLAWIDKETRLPLKREDELYVYEYRYATVAPRSIAPPVEFQRMIDDMRHAKGR